jgi:putative hydrolase of the HAD superfamily
MRTSTAIMQAANALLLDALGTLLMLEPPAPLLRAQLADRFGIAVTELEAGRAIGAEITYYRAHLNEGRDQASLAALRTRCAEVLKGALPPAAELPVETLTGALLASLRFSVFPDVLPALAAARERGQRVVVVSNWDISLEDVLVRLELGPLLDGVVTSASVGARKPSRAIFEHALKLAGARPEDAIHVGDSPEEDVAGARGAGIEPILLLRDGGPGPLGVRTIATLADLA